MSIVFFEGFNHDNNDAIKLDSNYWTPSDLSSISFASGRTHNGVYIANSNYASGMAANKKLDLSNFTSPLTSTNSFGIGFWTNEYSIKPESRLMSIHNGATEVLTINIIQTTFSSTNDSIGLEILQNGVSKGIYDFKAVVGYNYGFNAPTGNIYIIYNSIYLEFYIDPKANNSLRIRVNGMDMINQASSKTTSITGFTNIDKISLYGTHNNWITNYNRCYDDFYLTNGNTLEDTLLGKDVKIYRVNPDNNTATSEWSNTGGWGPGIISSNDGDNSYFYTDIVDKVNLFNMSNLPVSTGSIGGIKVLNTARKVAGTVSFCNVYAPSDGQAISNMSPIYTVDSTTYKYFNSFFLKNPANNNDWTINDINNIQLGMKKLS